MCKKLSPNLIAQTLLSPIVRGQERGMISQSSLAQNLSQGHHLSIDRSCHYFEAQWEGSFSKFMQVLDLVPCDLWGEEAPSIPSHPSHEAAGFHHVDKCESKEGWARGTPESSVTTSQISAHRICHVLFGGCRLLGQPTRKGSLLHKPVSIRK